MIGTALFFCFNPQADYAGDEADEEEEIGNGAIGWEVGEGKWNNRWGRCEGEKGVKGYFAGREAGNDAFSTFNDGFSTPAGSLEG